MAYWYGVDARDWGLRERRAWSGNLARCHADRRLRCDDLSGIEPESIRKLVELATEDKQLAHDVMVEVYTRRLWSSAERQPVE